MAKCHACERTLQRKLGTYRYVECGLKNVWLESWTMLTCEIHGDQVPILSHASILETAIVWKVLGRPEVLSADAIHFLRKALGMRGADLAARLDVSRVEVSRWERGHASINPHNEFKLRVLAAQRLLPERMQAELMKAFGELLIDRRKGAGPSEGPIFLHPNAVEEVAQAAQA